MRSSARRRRPAMGRFCCGAQLCSIALAKSRSEVGKRPPIAVVIPQLADIDEIRPIKAELLERWRLRHDVGVAGNDPRDRPGRSAADCHEQRPGSAERWTRQAERLI